MKTLVVVDAGICGFQTRIHAQSEDAQNVTFRISSGCGKVRTFAESLKAREPIDAYAEFGSGDSGVVLGAGIAGMKECCKGCVVPAGAFKAMQVAAGLALPKDVTLTVAWE
jgi:hypothetical protein